MIIEFVRLFDLITVSDICTKEMNLPIWLESLVSKPLIRGLCAVFGEKPDVSSRILFLNLLDKWILKELIKKNEAMIDNLLTNQSEIPHIKKELHQQWDSLEQVSMEDLKWLSIDANKMVISSFVGK